MKKKIITGVILVAAAGLLVAASILGTLAYLTSSSSVSNTFTVGNVGIHMYEHLVGSNGKFASVDSEGNPTSAVVDGNSYHLQPGGEYDKDPYITVDSASDESYLFVKIRNDLRNVEADTADKKHNGDDYVTLSEQVAEHGWIYIGRTSNANVFVYNKFVGGASDEVNIEIFDEFKIDTAADLSTSGAAVVTLFGFAIQTTGFKPAIPNSNKVTGVDIDKNNTNDMDAARAAWNAIGTVYTYQETTLTHLDKPFQKGDNNYSTDTNVTG